MFADSVMPVLLQAAVFVRENKAVRAEEVLGQFAEKFPDEILEKTQLQRFLGSLNYISDLVSLISFWRSWTVISFLDLVNLL